MSQKNFNDVMETIGSMILIKEKNLTHERFNSDVVEKMCKRKCISINQKIKIKITNIKTREEV